MPIAPGQIIDADSLVRHVWTMNTSASSTISTTEVSELETTISVPTDWTSYDVFFVVTVRVFETGTATAARAVTLRLREGSGTGGTEIDSQSETLDGTSPTNSFPLAFMGTLTGETATGSVTYSLTSQINGDDLQFTYSKLRVLVHAFRTD